MILNDNGFIFVKITFLCYLGIFFVIYKIVWLIIFMVRFMPLQFSTAFFIFQTTSPKYAPCALILD